MKIYNYFDNQFHSNEDLNYQRSTIVIPSALNSGGAKPIGSYFLYSNDNLTWSLHRSYMLAAVTSLDSARAWDSFDQYFIEGGHIHFNTGAPMTFLGDDGILVARVSATTAPEFIAPSEIHFGADSLFMHSSGGTCYIYKKAPLENSWSSIESWSGGTFRGACATASELLVTTLLSAQGRYRLFDRGFNVLSEGDTPIAGKVTRRGDRWFLRNGSSNTLYYATTYTSSSMDWTACVGITGSAVRSIAYGNGVYVAITSSGVLRSTDGVNWSSVTALSGSYGNYEWVGFVNGEFLIFRGSTSLYAASTDGSTWTNRNINDSVPISSITISMVRTFGENEVY